ncbi:hypothetical protein, partial [Campylobacter upsaliensis]|uniref:hypothetical protein n=1 Tax=Campylobacter upsaliensis TaxID=28080 RepID=UPI0022EB2FFB
MKGLICSNLVKLSHTRGGGGGNPGGNPLKIIAKIPLSLTCFIALAITINPTSILANTCAKYGFTNSDRVRLIKITYWCRDLQSNYNTTFKDILQVNKQVPWFGVLSDAQRDVANNPYLWTNISLENNGKIEELLTRTDAKVEVMAKTNNKGIIKIGNDGILLSLKTQNGATLQVTTLDQNSNGSTEIYDGVNVTNANVNNGKFYQQGGTITNLTIDNGTFTKAKGSVTGTITNTNGNINNMTNSSINTITSTNGNITNAGTITSLTYTAAPTTKAIQTKASTDSITNTGTITTFTNNGGNLTNTGSIQTYTQESGNTMQSGGTIQTLTQKGGSFTYQGGTIGSLKQEGGSFNNLQQNISLFTTQGGSLNNYQGTIENLKITSGDFELNN